MPAFASFLAGDALFCLHRFFPLTTVLIFIIAAVCLYLGKKSLLIPVILIGIIYALVRLSPGHREDIRNRVVSITGTFSPTVRVTLSGREFRTFDIERAVDPGTGTVVQEMEGREAVVFQDIGPASGGRYELLFRTGNDAARLNPGAGKRGDRIYGTVLAVREAGAAGPSFSYWLSKLRDRLDRYITGRFRGDGGALISAVTTGEKAYLSNEGREAFSATGLAHLLSISGTHFGLFSVILFGIFLYIIRRLPYRMLLRLTIYLTPQQAAALLCIPFMLMYLAISGGKIPAVRSFIMIGLFLAGLIMGRKGFWLNSLFLAAFLLALWDPAVILSLSFQLSFIAVLFIGFAVERKNGEEEDGHNDEGHRVLRFFRSSARLTFAAFLGTAPLAAYYFHLFPAISPLSNLLVAPLVGFVLVPLSLFSAFSFLTTGVYIFAPIVGKVADLSVALVKEISKIPFAGLAIPSFPPALCIVFYLGFLLYLIAGRRKELLIVPFIPFLAYALITGTAGKELSVTFLDVGQGDSAVIELPDDKAIVVDTGNTGRETAAFLKYRGRKKIDALVLTHIHPDHAGGYGHLMDLFEVSEVWDNGLVGYPGGMKAVHRMLERGDRVATADYGITVLHPHRGFHPSQGSEYDGENDSSLVLRVSGRKVSFLFAGDIEEQAQEDLAHLKGWLRSDVLKVPHHGSRTSSGTGFLSLVSPSAAVISVGKDNPFGHPAPQVLEELAGSKIFRTDMDGAVNVRETRDGLRIKTCRDFSFHEPQGFRGELKNLELLFSTW